MVNNSAAIIQARLSSVRLPNKVLLNFYKGKSILELIIVRLLTLFSPNNIIVATTDNHIDDRIIARLSEYKINIFRGNENNVLLRFLDAADLFEIDYIYRICADNPFLDVKATKFMVNNFVRSSKDYWTYAINGTPSIKSHFGFWGEAVTTDALRKIQLLTNEKKYREHVTSYIYENPEKFNIHFENVLNDLNSFYTIRLTIDTLGDFILCQEIYNNILENNIAIESESLAKYVCSNKRWMKSMKSEIDRNKK